MQRRLDASPNSSSFNRSPNVWNIDQESSAAARRILNPATFRFRRPPPPACPHLRKTISSARCRRSPPPAIRPPPPVAATSHLLRPATTSARPPPPAGPHLRKTISSVRCRRLIPPSIRPPPPVAATSHLLRPATTSARPPSSAASVECDKMQRKALLSSSFNRSSKFCCICMENKSFADFMVINHCLHRYCSKCVGRYVSEKIRNNVAVIACPHPGCKIGTLGAEKCKPFLAHEVFDHWYNVLMKDKVSCPFEDCSGLVYRIFNSQGKCRKCCRLFCLICQSIWHPKLACKDVQQLRKEDMEQEDYLLVELANKQGWNRCPFCCFYVEKVSGCMNILCRCGQSFYYK